MNIDMFFNSYWDIYTASTTTFDVTAISTKVIHQFQYS